MTTTMYTDNGQVESRWLLARRSFTETAECLVERDQASQSR